MTNASQGVPHNDDSATAAGSHLVTHSSLGSQLLLDLYDCDPVRLDDVEWVRSSMLDAAAAAGATVVESVFHRFSPWGVSGVVVISESHLAIHTWPEKGYAAVDVFTCGSELQIPLAQALLTRAFSSPRAVQRFVTRGADVA
jgi:S-adenosylmethionine decarboxylase proenzyme